MNRKFLKKILIVLLLAGLICFTYQLGGWILSELAIEQISKLTNTKVTAKSVDFSLNGSVTLKELVIEPEKTDTYDNTILNASEVYVEFSRLSFMFFNPKVQKLRANNFKLNILYNADTGDWNVSGMSLGFEAQEEEFKPPTINLKNGQVQYGTMQDNKIKRLTRIPLEVEMSSSEEEPEAYRFRIKTAKRKGFAGKSELNGIWQPGRVWVSGDVSAKDMPNFELNWFIYALAAELKYDDNGNYELDLSVKDFVSEHKLDRLSLGGDEGRVLKKFGLMASLRKFFNRYRPSGRINIKLDASGNINNLKKSSISGTIVCEDASIHDRKFPYPINHLEGDIDFTKNSVHLKNLKGRHEEVEVRIFGEAANFGEDKTSDIHLVSDNMRLDEDLSEAIPEKYERFWEKFLLEGKIQVHLNSVRRPGSEKITTIRVHPLDVNAVYKPFPYPLKKVSGELIFEEGKADINKVVSEYKGRKITINGNFNSIQSSYALDIRCENIPVDEQLKSVLSRTNYNFESDFQLTRGKVDAEIEIRKTKQEKERALTAEVNLKNAAVKTGFLTGKITDIHSELIFEPGKISINKLEGKAQGGRLSINGEYSLSNGNTPTSYDLLIKGEAIDLREIPVNKLAPFTAETDIFEKLQLRGTADYLLKISKREKQDTPDYNLRLDFTGGTINFRNIPYSLHEINGSITAANGKIKFSDLKGILKGGLQITDRNSRISLNGNFDFKQSELVKGELAIKAEDIPLDENLKTILSNKAGTVYENLAPAGRFDLNFRNCNVLRKNGNYIIELEGQVKLENFKSAELPLVDDISLSIDTNCVYSTKDGLEINKGRIESGKLKIKGKTVKNISADLSFAPRTKVFYVNNITGDFYGGRIAGNLSYKTRKENGQKYYCKLYIDNVSLEKFLEKGDEEIPVGKKYSNGVFSGTMQLKGGNSSAGVTGSINILIKDIKAGKISLPGKILRVIRRKPAAEYAFRQATIEAYIRKDALLVQDLYLYGEGLNLRGNGVINLLTDRLYLLFAVKSGKPQMMKPGIIGSLTEALGSAVVRIEATGSIYEPEVKTTTLPVLKETIQLLGKPRR